MPCGIAKKIDDLTQYYWNEYAIYVEIRFQCQCLRPEHPLARHLLEINIFFLIKLEK